MAAQEPVAGFSLQGDPALSQTLASLEARLGRLEQLLSPPRAEDIHCLSVIPGAVAATDKDEQGALLRLGAYIDRRIQERLVGHSQARWGEQARSESHGPHVIPTVEAGPASEDAQLEPADLDRGDTYSMEESVWDMSLFVGHPCLGTPNSLGTMVAYLANCALQVGFIIIVWRSLMDSNNLDPRTLDGLLRFRLGIAHSIEYADVVLEQSLASQICNQDLKMHYAGAQMRLFSGIKAGWIPGDGTQLGPILAMLAQLLWVGTILREICQTIKFVRTVLALPRVPATSVCATQGGEAARLDGIHRGRCAGAVLFIAVPRFVLAGLLGVTGVKYLGQTSAMGDLILNAIALAFVLDCDELVFQVFVPQRTWALQARLEPIPVPMQPITAKFGSWAIPLARLLLVSAALLLIYLLVLNPFHGRLKQARNILCSGDLDFVYAESSATGLVHIARSKQFSSEDFPSYVEEVVLQVASQAQDWVELSSEHGLDVPTKLKDIVGIMENGYFDVLAQIEPGVESFGQAVFSTTAFGEIVEMKSRTTEIAAEYLPCADLGVTQSRQAALDRLRRTLGDPSISTCDDVPWQYCSQWNMTQLRALCPTRCSCTKAPGDGSLTGFFGHPKYGCPAQCTSLMGAHSEQEYLDFQSDYANYSADCADLQSDHWIFSDSCGNTDSTTTGDKYGEYCDEDKYDTATTRACTSGYYDDDDFSAPLMCCGCGGGNSSGVASSKQCVDDLTDACHSTMGRAPFFWVLYVRGLFDYFLLERSGFEEMLASNMEEPALNISQGLRSDFTKYILNGSMMRSLVDQSWEFMPGLDHPRDLVGCDYLTSWEFRMLLSIDLCSPDSFTSIQRLCPASCGCGPGSPPSQCPQQCL